MAQRKPDTTGSQTIEFGRAPDWHPTRPRFSLARLMVHWGTSAFALYIAAILVPGVTIEGAVGAFVAAALIAVLNALLPPVVAALRLPFALLFGFILVLLLDAWMIQLAATLSDGSFRVDSFWDALLVALVASAVSLATEVVLGTNDDEGYSLRVAQRIARRSTGA